MRKEKRREEEESKGDRGRNRKDQNLNIKEELHYMI